MGGLNLRPTGPTLQNLFQTNFKKLYKNLKQQKSISYVILLPKCMLYMSSWGHIMKTTNCGQSTKYLAESWKNIMTMKIKKNFFLELFQTKRLKSTDDYIQCKCKCYWDQKQPSHLILWEYLTYWSNKQNYMSYI